MSLYFYNDSKYYISQKSQNIKWTKDKRLFRDKLAFLTWTIWSILATCCNSKSNSNFCLCLLHRIFIWRKECIWWQKSLSYSVNVIYHSSFLLWKLDRKIYERKNHIFIYVWILILKTVLVLKQVFWKECWSAYCWVREVINKMDAVMLPPNKPCGFWMVLATASQVTLTAGSYVTLDTESYTTCRLSLIIVPGLKPLLCTLR